MRLLTNFALVVALVVSLLFIVVDNHSNGDVVTTPPPTPVLGIRYNNGYETCNYAEPDCYSSITTYQEPDGTTIIMGIK